MHVACMVVTDIHSLYLILHMLFVLRYFNAHLIFRQLSSGHHDTAYRQQGVVPEDVWARLSGVCKGHIPLYIKAMI